MPISQMQLIKLLADVQGCTFAALDTTTEPQLLGGKANPMKGKVAKQMIGGRVILFTNKSGSGYLKKVVRHLAKEGKVTLTKDIDQMSQDELREHFNPGPLPWGERIPETPLILNKGKLYLQCVFMGGGKVEYRATEEILFNTYQQEKPEPKLFGCTNYEAGDYIPKENIPGLPDRTGSEHQGLDNEVIVRCFALDNIDHIRLMGEQL